ncbi:MULTISPECIES: hypothetical protein [unclassified Cupriavidus]|uniref:hypothetical protein n=1 Tax=Cupriavidus sp. H19C3 TaxID=3241603 RepID=UPI003BF8F477
MGNPVISTRMTISALQKRMIELLNAGYSLRIVRSPLNGLPVYAVLCRPEPHTEVEAVPWWRVERLLRTGRVRLNCASLEVATHIVPL